ncbi:glycosyltransferase [Planktothrix sp. FACHB-1355]|uniref:Glycosyltransferase n=1 Tax=Aerosakkonema funiforme FACHB-1375 TaxID=2949571 RepID=A0A926VH62_9CYAN|nr:MULTISPECIES: glycosyltransferase [Oscillatoriales]MBD2183658.1 glycosyltransferase [Aerosakkonema funiforme FACHB-1375]MBD3559500.1 glycosyltransferase [Planktothrix sp. FACHB-1355]
MKTIQAVARYFPESCGGIHIHLSEIMPVLQAMGVESKVAASGDEPKEDFYTYKGVEVYRYPVFPTPKPEPNHGASFHGGFEHFARWLKEQKADIYHQHQWTPKCGLPHLRLAKELGMGTAVSVRLPQPICQRQTLMLNGEEACDGKIDPVRCGYCCGVSQNLPASVVKSLSYLPVGVSQAAAGVMRRLEKAPGSIEKTANALLKPIAIPGFAAARLQGLQEMAKYADRIVVMSEWVGEALTINGIPREKLFLLRHGIAESFADAYKQTVLQPKKPGEPLKVGFLGRWDRTKGIHIIVEAVKSLPSDVPIELIIHGVASNDEYRKQVLSRIGDDPRIRVAKQLKREELGAALSGFDVLTVPSQWLETGPVVVLEGHAYRVPVVGSKLGGIAEKVKHGVDGLLVPASDVKAWADAFAQLALNPDLLYKLRQGIQPVRTISMEAVDSLTLYQSILAERSELAAYNVGASLQLQPL